MDHNSRQPSHITLECPALSCPLMPLVEQYFHTHCKSYKLLTNNQNPHKQQNKTFIVLIVLLKPQTIKYGHQ
jgi:hypothetical protein